MDGLRWLLLFFGILVIAGVYLYSRRDKGDSEDTISNSKRVEPTLKHDGVDSGADSDLDDGAEAEDTASPGHEVADDVPQKIVTLRLVAHEKQAFQGDDLILSMRGIGLRHGKFGIFHRYAGNDETRTVFSAASLVEPGSFDLENIKDQRIPGISLFLVLPAPIDSIEAFDLMMSTARALAQSLNGELLDESGSTLSIQRERYLREEIIQYQHSILVA
ncbi:MAG: cell division protein ZipA [Gammaproteobacteria bacterium]|nr:cell division protein ZipA [Gammaproteobacteria bacterium]